MPDGRRSFSEEHIGIVCESQICTYRSTRSASCCPCPCSTDIDCAVDVYQENRVAAARRDYRNTTMPRQVFVGECALRFRSTSASKLFDLCVRSAISYRELTFIHVDFSHTFGDVEFAVSLHMHHRVTVVHPLHSSKRSLVATACCKQRTSEIRIVVQAEPQWAFRLHM